MGRCGVNLPKRETAYLNNVPFVAAHLQTERGEGEVGDPQPPGPPPLGPGPQWWPGEPAEGALFHAWDGEGSSGSHRREAGGRAGHLPCGPPPQGPGSKAGSAHTRAGTIKLTMLLVPTFTFSSNHNPHPFFLIAFPISFSLFFGHPHFTYIYQVTHFGQCISILFRPYRGTFVHCLQSKKY